MSKKSLVSPPVLSALAKNLADQVFPVKNRLKWQGILHVLVLPRVIAAGGAGIAPKIFHTAQAFVQFHGVRSFLYLLLR